MTDRPRPLERAFELARSGDFTTLTALRKHLATEGHSAEQISGPSIKRQLRALCALAKAAP